MWSHYADCHTGLRLEFRRAADNFLAGARRVQYPEDDGFPFVDYWEQKPGEQIEEFAKVVLTKAKHWAYEKEWRALERREEVSDGYAGHIVSYPPELLAGVIFGLSMPRERRETLRKLPYKRLLRFYEARTVRNRFQLEIAEVS